MHCGAPASGIRTVDDVVVNQRGRVEQFERAGSVEQAIEFLIGLVHELDRHHGAEPQGAELGSQTLAAREIRSGFFEHWEALVSQRGEIVPMCGDDIGNALLNEACESCRFIHVA